jgi:DNA-binding MarR family transcriptional regulator
MPQDDHTRAPSALTDHLGYWLRLVSNQVSHAFQRKVEATGVTIAEWVLLRALFDVGSLYQHELADALNLTRGAISKLVERLISKQLVSCHIGEQDRRYLRVALTDAGRALVPALAALADQNDDEHFGHLNDQERASLLVLLQGIAQQKHLQRPPLT